MTNDDQQCSTIMNNDISRMGKGLQITKKIQDENERKMTIDDD